jgi:mono/diheme cytochrome c family protein
MKKLSILVVLFATTAVLISCSDIKRKPNRIYMPDMFYSRAYQTYSDHCNLTKEGIFYNEKPVPGTIFRGEDMPFPLAKDAPGDTANYVASKQIKSPIDSLTQQQYVEAERLFLINCAICHGPKLDGNGPLYKGGEGPYPAKPAQLVGDAKYEAMPEGQMFYSVEYGKNLMGSYASQLSRQQRWEIIRYIKMKQAEAKANSASATASK